MFTASSHESYANRVVDVFDTSGDYVDKISQGHQVILSSQIRGTVNEPQSFVAIFEVRDANGFTILLAWQSGIMSPDSITKVGVSWIPESSGDYQVRQFVLSNMTSPTVLQEVKTTNLLVYE
jgi:hypothetical protein